MSNNQVNSQKQLVVPILDRLFLGLRYATLYSILRSKISPSLKDAPIIPEIRVIFGVVASFVVLAAANLIRDIEWLAVFVGVFGLYMIYETIIALINIVLFDQKRNEDRGQTYQRHSYVRSLVLVLLNYAEITLWFAAIFLLWPNHFEMPSGRGAAVASSLARLTTFGDSFIELIEAFEKPLHDAS